MGGQTGKKRKGGNTGVGVDFKKVKHKVGKKLPKAQNETDTTIRARSINLPSQAIKEDKDGQATNFQKLTLKELLSQTVHYSEKMRKAALTGLSDLFSRHPEELTSHVGLVYSKLMERVADADSSVRQALQALLRERMSPLVAPGQLRPFMPLIMAHVAGATTHLSLEVRSDALVFLDILMDHCPHLVAGGHLVTCLSHFCDLLSPAHRSRSVKGQSLKALIKVLQALCAFLRRAFPRSTPAAQQSTARAATPAQQHHAPTSLLPLLRRRCAWHAAAPTSTSHGDSQATLAPSNTPATPHSAAGGAAGASTSRSPSSNQTSASTSASTGTVAPTVQQASTRLLSLLLDCWPECSPATLSVSPEGDQTTALVLILTALQQITAEPTLHCGVAPSASSRQPGGGALVATQAAGAQGGAGAAAQQQLPPTLSQALLRCVSTHFPACLPAVRPAQPVLDSLIQFNLLSGQLLARMLPTSLPAHQHHHGALAHLSHHQQHGHQQQQEQEVPQWVGALVSFYERVLSTGEVLPAGALLSQAHTSASAVSAAGGGQQQQGGGGGGGGRGGQGSAAALAALGGVEELLCVLPLEQAAPLVAAVEAFAAGLAPRSSLRASCLQLQRRLMARWRAGELQLDASWVVSWLSSLPRLLWELGPSASPGTWALALGTLHDAACFSADGSELALAVRRLQPQLAPLWSLHVLGKAGKGGKGASTGGGGGGGGQQEGKVMAGPVTQLPERLQALATDVLCQLGPLEPPLLSATLRVLRHQLLPSPAAALRLVEALLHTATCCAPDAATSLVASLLLMTPPPPSASTPPQPPQDQQDAAGAAPSSQQQQQQQQQQGDGWAVRQWAVCDVVLRQLPQVLPASVLLLATSDAWQGLLAPLVAQGSAKKNGAAVAGESPLALLLDSSGGGGNGDASGAAGGDSSGAGAALAVHVRVVLHLVLQARDELLVPGHATVTGPLPAWLQQALPTFITWHSMASRLLLPGAAGGNAGAPVLAVQQVVQPGKGAGWAQEQVAAQAVVLQLCAGQDGLALSLLQHAAQTGKQLHEGASSGQQQQAAARTCHAALLALACALLTDGVTRRQCLAAGQAAKVAVEQLGSRAGLPGHVAADLTCTSLAQQLSQATQDLFGMSA